MSEKHKNPLLQRGTYLVLLVMSLLFILWFNRLQVMTFLSQIEPWQEISFTIPEESTKLTLLMKQTNPGLAEYHRKLKIEHAEKPAITIELPKDAGGDNLSNVYRHIGVLQDSSKVTLVGFEVFHGDYLIDLKNNRLTYPDELKELSKGQYIGTINGRGKTAFEFTPAGKGEKPKIHKAYQVDSIYD